MKKAEVFEKIREFFEENECVFDDAIEELDSWNGYLDDDRCYSMGELDGLLSGKSVSDILDMAYYGYDEESEGAFCPNRDYFKFDCGRLVSCDHKDYTDRLGDYFIKSLIRERGNLYIGNDELNELLDEYTQAEE